MPNSTFKALAEAAELATTSLIKRPAIVYKEHSFGILRKCGDQFVFEVLNGLGSRGGIPAGGSPVFLYNDEDYRPAKFEDFKVFRVAPSKYLILQDGEIPTPTAAQ